MFQPNKGSLHKKNVTLFKVVFKFHFRPFSVILVKKLFGGGVQILSHFLAIFGFWKFLQVFDISRGQKTLFFKKCPNNGLVSEKKYIEKFSILGGWGGSDPSMENSILFFFFFFEGFPYGHFSQKRSHLALDGSLGCFCSFFFINLP